MSEVNKNIVQTFLSSKGLNNKAIAGVMGNIQQESNFETTATNSSSGAYGLFQWLGSRKTALLNYAESVGKGASDIQTQLDFFWNELETTESKTKKVLFNSNYSTASEYAEAFEKSFERSNGSALQKRKDYAESYYNQLSNGTFTDISSGSNSVSSSGSNSVRKNTNIGLEWWGDVVKVVLILLLIVVGVLLGVLSVNSTVEEIT